MHLAVLKALPWILLLILGVRLVIDEIVAGGPGLRRGLAALLPLALLPRLFLVPDANEGVWELHVVGSLAMGTALPVLLALLVRVFGGRTEHALWTGFLWCVFPPAVRLAGGDFESTRLVFLVVTSLLGTASTLASRRIGGLLVAVLASGLAFTIRPDALVLSASLPLLVWLHGGPGAVRGRVGRWAWALAVVVAIGGLALLLRDAIGSGALDSDVWVPQTRDLDPAGQAWMRGDRSPVVLWLLVVLGGTLLVRERHPLAWWTLASLLLASLLAGRLIANGRVGLEAASLIPAAFAVIAMGRGAEAVRSWLSRRWRGRGSPLALGLLVVIWSAFLLWTEPAGAVRPWGPGDIARSGPGDWFFVLLLYGAWGFLLAEGISLVTRASGWRPDRWTVALLLLFAVGVLLRLWLATWGPGDFYAKQAGSFDPVAGPSFRGSAPAVLARILFTVLPESDRTLVALSLFLGALAPVLLARIVQKSGAPRARALVAGLLLAVHPLALRFSGDQSRQMLALSLGLFSLLALLEYRRSERLRSLAVAGVSAWLCFRSRPEAGVILPMAWGFVLLVLPRRWADVRAGWFRRTVVAMLVTSAVVVVLYFWWRENDATSVRQMGRALEFRPDFLTRGNAVWLADCYTPSFVVGLLGLGSVVGLLRRDRLALWAMLSLLGGTYVLSTMGVSKEALANARYQTLLLPVMSVLVATGLSAPGEILRLWRRARDAWWGYAAEFGLLMAVFVMLAPRVASVTEPRTIDLEYAFLREQVAALPRDARVYIVFPPGDSMQGGVQNPDALSLILGRRDVRWYLWPPEAEDGSGPAFYYHAGNCSIDPAGDFYGMVSKGWARGCREALATTREHPVAEARLKALDYDSEPFLGDELTVGFYRIPGAE